MRGLHFFAELSTKVLSLSRISLGLLYFSCFPVQTAVRKISFSGKKHLHSPIKYHPLASVTIDCGCNCSKTEPLHVVRWMRQILYLYTGKVQGTMSRKNNLVWSVLELLSIFWVLHHPTHTAHTSSPLDNPETMLFGEQPCMLEMCKYWHLCPCGLPSMCSEPPDAELKLSGKGACRKREMSSGGLPKK